ncbi:glycosyltransferase family 2 protein, partial [Fischerella muscicola]
MISVITPVYNGEKFIESCIKVVIEQNCPNVEHIIIDGGSKDGTVEIIKQYAKHYPHIRWISEKDQGQSDAMNKGIAMAKGEIISFLNVDDFYEPNVLNRVLKLFEKLPEPSLVVGNCNIWGDSQELKLINKPKKLKIEYLLSETSPFPY